MLLEQVRLLGREFVRRDMQVHARKLRVYYLALRHGLVGESHELDVHWNGPFVRTWLETLQLPPFEKALPSRPRGSLCAACHREGAQPSTRTELLFPGGARMRCSTCDGAWIESDP